MFIADQITLEAGVPAVRASLVKLATGGLMAQISQAAYREGGQELLRAGPVQGLPGTLRLAQVRMGELTVCAAQARLPLRWEVTGPGGRWFPALDADITLTGDGQHATVMALTGAYHPPPSLAATGLDQDVIRRCAARTTHGFLSRLACAVVHPAGQPQPAHVQ